MNPASNRHRRLRTAARPRGAILVALAAALASVLIPGQARADIAYDAAGRFWSLKTGPVEYRLAETDGGVALAYLGPPGPPSWAAPKPRLRPYVRFDTSGQVEGQPLDPESLNLVSQEIGRPAADRWELLLVFRHRHLPLELDERYATWGDTGVLTRQVTLVNRGDRVLNMESTPSLAWLLPGGDYGLDTLHGTWGEERQLATETLGIGRRDFVDRTGRSSDGFSPWFCLNDRIRGVRYGAQLAYSGNWQMSFERYTEQRLVPLQEQDLRVEMGMRYDFGGPARLEPGASFALPYAAFTASSGDLDDLANQFHRYQRRYVMPRMPGNAPLITQLNTWEPLGRYATSAEFKKYADIAAELGLEAVGMDAAWVVKSGRKSFYGDWRPDPTGYPGGLRELSDYVHAKGMKLCVWLEPETTSKFAPMAVRHPEWLLKFNGVPMQGTYDRVYWDFRHPELRAWIRGVVDRLVRDDRIDWLKIDYNIDVGERFDPSGPGRSGTVLYDHLRALYAWLDSIRAAYPNLIIENCSSGSLRQDLALLARTQFGWLSDIVDPRASCQLAYGGTIEFAPEACFHWMAGDGPGGRVDNSGPPGWWDFMFRVPMNGPFAISSRAVDWSPELMKRAAENIALYKRLRSVIAGSDVYHLTPPPAAGEHPTGWMALQYAAPDAGKSAVLVYRLGQSESRRVLHLRGLNPSLAYTVSIDGVLQPEPRTGRSLATEGLAISLDSEWRAAAVELAAKP